MRHQRRRQLLSLQGLLVRPSGLLFIYLKRRSRAFVIAWIGSAVVAGVLYVGGFNFNASREATADPAAALAFSFGSWVTSWGRVSQTPG